MALLQASPEELLQMLAYASKFPDFPKNFTLPYVTNPKYIPPANSARLEIFAYVMAIITTASVIARLWIRKWVKGMVFGVDDWLIIPGQILTLGVIVDMILLIRIGGAGRHIYDVSFDRIVITQKLQFAGVMIYFAAIFFIRLSITAFMYRFIGLTSDIKRMLLHVTAAILAVQFLVQVIAYVFSCKPISAAWDINVRLAGFSSINVPLEIFILTIFYLLMDVWLLVFPLHTIWSLSLPLRTRMAVTWVFIFGGVACAGAILKTAHVYSVFDSFDPLWNGIGFMAGSLIEVSFGVISSSMPAMNHLITTAFAKSLEKWLGPTRISLWLGSGSGEMRSFRQTFHDITIRNKDDTIIPSNASHQDSIHLSRLSTERSGVYHNTGDLESNCTGSAVSHTDVQWK